MLGNVGPAATYNKASVAEKEKMNKLIENLLSEVEQKNKSDKLKDDNYFGHDISVRPNFKSAVRVKVKSLKISKALPKIFFD